MDETSRGQRGEAEEVADKHFDDVVLVKAAFEGNALVHYMLTLLEDISRRFGEAGRGSLETHYGRHQL